MKREKRFNLVTIFYILTGAAVLIVCGAFLSLLFRQNPYGKQVKIDNFNEFFGDTPNETKDALFASLYDMIELNSQEGADIPSEGAQIRVGSNSLYFDSEKNMTYGEFIVDIEKIEQSYSGYFEWSSNANNVYYSGYQTLYSCLKNDELIYGDFGCKDMFAGSITEEYPITGVLPVMVEYYSADYSNYTKYYISYEIEDSEVVLMVDDYTGGNLERAKDKIRELGFDPVDYKIAYHDLSDSDRWVYVGDQ